MKSLSREVVWMVVPVLFLGGVGYFLRHRQPAVLVVAKPFQPYVKGWKHLLLRPADVADGYDTRLEVELGADGTKPAWWNKGTTERTSTNSGMLISNFKGQTKIWSTNILRWPPQRQKDGRWTTEYLFNRRALPVETGEAHLQDRVEFKIDNKQWPQTIGLDIPVRRVGEVVPRPVVSTDPGVVLEKYELDDMGEGDRELSSEYWNWRLKLYFRKTGKPVPQSMDSLSGDLHVVDSNDKVVKTYNAVSPDFSPKGSIKIWETNFSYNDQKSSKLAPPLFLEGKFQWNDRWPLHVKIPFRDTRNRVLLIPIKPTFRITSVTAVSVKPQAAEDGEDKIVHVQIIPSGKTVALDEWEDWVIQNPPAIVDAKGKIYSGLPAKNGVENFPVTQEVFNQGNVVTGVKLSYPLVLRRIPKSAGRLTFKNEITVTGGDKSVPISVVVRP